MGDAILAIGARRGLFLARSTDGGPSGAEPVRSATAVRGPLTVDEAPVAHPHRPRRLPAVRGSL
ncbi:hypothetical protein Misp01_16890 [Microtetraspora sp. NBRC 13810]|uniref:hypothetical protein n=1 Tax=Microtetraspora sp. NBRC 13810 TaxID=3030990 RepID=UPI0024A5FA5C|nr:hypothetical protein [Microtetraspora sp. NBRC 13810]GLW06559.1 hypothetical protein Misp01_16890 [Microtetraspora sp. NBRC 13810]